MKLSKSALLLTVLWVFATKVWAFPTEDDALAVVRFAEAKAETESALKSFHPKKGRNPPQTSFAEMRCTLWGNLFGDGRIFAVTALLNEASYVTYAEWDQGSWAFRGVIPITADWLPSVTRSMHEGALTPASPFLLKDLNGDGFADLVITFNNDGYRLGYAIAIYSTSRHRLNLLDEYSSTEPPRYHFGCLVTYADSGRKFWWGEDRFYRWKGKELEWKATWRGDGEVTVITFPGSQPEAEITLKDGENEKDAPDYIVELDGKRATIKFSYSVPKGVNRLLFGNDIIKAEELWLFEALTHLPWQAAGKQQTYVGDPKECKRLQKYLRVKVAGDPELLKLLNPAIKMLNGKESK